ncbi:30S ribosomal protein S15 [Candidatus Woesearchaeota archaeon CG10_big_fil_rev_8_21_14_0_10_34_8]|nr:MAG: 30S ribosomal protein S15 [Candidatus Woesearchaeota archaeon CG10_big_fil_rev_8_21_14_0_10_34_8]
MARMYSRKKGRSGSTKPIDKKVQAWVRYKPKEVEMLVLKMAKEGKTSSQIGLMLRDKYGIPSVKSLLGKSVSELLKSKDLQPEIPDDLMALIRSSISLEKHIEENKQDMTAKRGEQLTTSKILRLVKYYKNSGKLPQDWKFDKSKVRLLIE